jgi:protein tyrosine phosphatase
VLSQEASYPYWPSSTFSPVQYGKISIVKTCEEEFESYIMRKFEITGVPAKSLSVSSNNLSPSFVVTHYQFLEWSEEKSPNNTMALIELMEKVNKVQMTSGNKSITVMCK